MSKEVILYAYFRSTCSWRVRIALSLKGIPYEVKPVHLVKKEQFADEYGALNPLKQVPTLLIDGKTLTQSLPIIEYLEETLPNQGAPLLPSDPAKRVQSRIIAEMINSGIQPLQNLGPLSKLPESERVEWGHHFVKEGFDAVEKVLVTTAGKCCVGDEITMADLCLIPQIANATRRFKVDLTPYPTIVRIDAYLADHPAFVAAHPSKQPDFAADQ